MSLVKKQGVSGQSVDTRKEPVKLEYHEKDFRAKTLMKEAIMENDFLKNLSPQQVKMILFYTFDMTSGIFR